MLSQHEGVTDEDLLVRVQKGLLRLSVDGTEVESFHAGWGRFITKKSNQHYASGRFRYQFGDSRRTIYKNRLVWMITNRRVIPGGFVVDHVDGNRLNDRQENLQLMLRGDSQRQGMSVQQAVHFQECWDYFTAIAFLGREPRWAADVSKQPQQGESMDHPECSSQAQYQSQQQRPDECGNNPDGQSLPDQPVRHRV